jgi:hypothetical protein
MEPEQSSELNATLDAPRLTAAAADEARTEAKPVKRNVLRRTTTSRNELSGRATGQTNRKR